MGYNKKNGNEITRAIRSAYDVLGGGGRGLYRQDWRGDPAIPFKVLVELK